MGIYLLPNYTKQFFCSNKAWTNKPQIAQKKKKTELHTNIHLHTCTQALLYVKYYFRTSTSRKGVHRYSLNTVTVTPLFTTACSGKQQKISSSACDLLDHNSVITDASGFHMALRKKAYSANVSKHCRLYNSYCLAVLILCPDAFDCLAFPLWSWTGVTAYSDV